MEGDCVEQWPQSIEKILDWSESIPLKSADDSILSEGIVHHPDRDNVQKISTTF